MLIYEIVGPENKVYIGATTCKLNKRKREHKCGMRDYPMPLYRAMRSYGFDKFIFKTLAEFTDIEEMYEYEKLLIEHYQKDGRAYNVANGKGGRFKRTPEQLEVMRVNSKKHANPKRMSDMAKAGWANEKTREVLLQKKRDWARNNPKLMEEKRNKSREVRLASLKPFVVKRKCGEKIGIFYLKSACAAKIGLSETSVYRYLKNQRKHKNLIFEYVEV